MSLAEALKQHRASRRLVIRKPSAPLTKAPAKAPSEPPTELELTEALKVLSSRLLSPERTYSPEELLEKIIVLVPGKPSDFPSKLISELTARGFIEATPGGSRYFLAGSTPF